MKVLIVLSVLVAFSAAEDARTPVLTPTELSMIEAFDYDALFANKEQSQMVFDCMLEKGDCGDYKQVAKLSMKTICSGCADCNPAQKEKYESVLKQFHDKYEPVYNEVMKKVAAKRAEMKKNE